MKPSCKFNSFSSALPLAMRRVWDYFLGKEKQKSVSSYTLVVIKHTHKTNSHKTATSAFIMLVLLHEFCFKLKYLYLSVGYDQSLLGNRPSKWSSSPKSQFCSDITYFMNEDKV